MIAVDATVLTLVLNEKADSPPDPATGKPVSQVKDRVDFLIQTLHKTSQKVIVPTPVLAEVLVRAGKDGLRYVEILQKASVVELKDFDKIAAIELALLTQQAIKAGGKKGGSKEIWQKIKLDRQIVAICKVCGVSTLYATDPSLANFAKLAGIAVVGVHDLPLPPEPPQLTMDRLLAQEAQTAQVEEPNPEDIEPEE